MEALIHKAGVGANLATMDEVKKKFINKRCEDFKEENRIKYQKQEDLSNRKKVRVIKNLKEALGRQVDEKNMNLRNEREARNMIQRDFEKQAKEYSIEN